jgi:hypothetical protein
MHVYIYILIHLIAVIAEDGPRTAPRTAGRRCPEGSHRGCRSTWRLGTAMLLQFVR